MDPSIGPEHGSNAATGSTRPARRPGRPRGEVGAAVLERPCCGPVRGLQPARPRRPEGQDPDAAGRRGRCRQGAQGRVHDRPTVEEHGPSFQEASALRRARCAARRTVPPWPRIRSMRWAGSGHWREPTRTRLRLRQHVLDGADDRGVRERVDPPDVNSAQVTSPARPALRGLSRPGYLVSSPPSHAGPTTGPAMATCCAATRPATGARVRGLRRGGRRRPRSRALRRAQGALSRCRYPTVDRRERVVEGGGPAGVPPAQGVYLADLLCRVIAKRADPSASSAVVVYRSKPAFSRTRTEAGFESSTPAATV